MRRCQGQELACHSSSSSSYSSSSSSKSSEITFRWTGCVCDTSSSDSHSGQLKISPSSTSSSSTSISAEHSGQRITVPASGSFFWPCGGTRTVPPPCSVLYTEAWKFKLCVVFPP